MEAALREAVEQHLTAATGRTARIRTATPCDGGCINHASRIELDDGHVYFLKWHSSPPPGMFEREAEGLAALHRAGAIRVPELLAPPDGPPPESERNDDDRRGSETTPGPSARRAVPPFLVLEYIESGRRGPRFFEEFGRRFARLHRETANDRFGFPHDNYLGTTPQSNAWQRDWPTFWRENRLGPQLDLARRHGRADAAFLRLGAKLLERLDALLAEPDEPPCLLHGDLWGGNYLADETGGPVVIDPAAYYGRGEADLAMTFLFGGFTPEFYAAYREVRPLADGAEARIDIYKLYHLLNHLNLFGHGYRESSMAILQRYAR